MKTKSFVSPYPADSSFTRSPLPRLLNAVGLTHLGPIVLYNLSLSSTVNDASVCTYFGSTTAVGDNPVIPDNCITDVGTSHIRATVLAGFGNCAFLLFS